MPALYPRAKEIMNESTHCKVASLNKADVLTDIFEQGLVVVERLMNQNERIDSDIMSSKLI